MQNQWFHNPTAVQAMFVRHPEYRNELIKRLLFAGCLSGRRLRQTFGNLCDKIIWEEASRNMADHSSGAFKADLAHITASIKQHQPDLIICFGKIAGDAVKSLTVNVPTFFAHHPTARGNPISALKDVAAKVRLFINKVDI